MRKVLLFLGVIAATLTSCSKDNDTMPQEAMATIKIESGFATLKSDSFNPAGKGLDSSTALYSDEIQVTIDGTAHIETNGQNPVSSASSFNRTYTINVSGTASDVLEEISEWGVDVPYGDYTVSFVAIGGDLPAASRLLVSGPVEVTTGGDVAAVAALDLAPASAYISLTDTAIDHDYTVEYVFTGLDIFGADAAAIEASLEGGVYVVPSADAITIQITLTGKGNVLSTTVEINEEAGKFYDLYFDLNEDGVTIDAGFANEFTPGL